MEGHSPPVMSGLAVAASGGEATDASDGVTKSEARSECITGTERRHMFSVHVPRGGDERREQAPGKDSSRLQRGDAENLARMCRVVAPLVNDVKNLRAQDSAEDNQDPEIPSLVTVVAEALGISNADPKTQEHTQRNKESVCREEETSDMNKLWEHWFLDARSSDELQDQSSRKEPCEGSRPRQEKLIFQADPLSRVTGPRMNPSVDVRRPPRPFRHLRMAQRCSPDPSSSRAPVHSALVQISVTRHHQRGRSAFSLDAREIGNGWQVESSK